MNAAHDPDARLEPAFAAPPHACDAHFHVFGPAERYPYGTDLRYRPPLAPLDDYLKLAPARVRALRVRAAERLRL